MAKRTGGLRPTSRIADDDRPAGDRDVSGTPAGAGASSPQEAIPPQWQPMGAPYPAMHPYAAPDARPLLDPSILIASLWRWRAGIVLTTVLGAVAGVMIALATPQKFYAQNRLFIDPREVQVTDDDARNQMLSTEAMLAITDSQVEILSSTSVLEKVVADLGLERDAEFNGSLSAGGLAGGIAMLKSLLSADDAAGDATKLALETLRKAVVVSRDAKTFIINVGVKTRDPEKSALIANRIVAIYLDEEGSAQAGLLERTSDSINQRLNALRADLDAAEREVETFKAENDIVDAGGELIDDKQILALNDQLSAARASKVAIKVRAENLAATRFDDVTSGSFPEELLSPTLAELRKQYAQSKASADSLATRLGPRHPQLIAAQSGLDATADEIRNELRRIVSASQTELQRAVEAEQDLSGQLAAAKSRSIDQSVEFVELRELERKANATRQIYESFLKRSRETAERSSLRTRNIRIISTAEPPLDPVGPSRKLIAIGGMLGGLMMGAGLALAGGAVTSLRSYNGMAPVAQFQPRAWPSAPHPEPSPESPPPGARNRRPAARDDDEDDHEELPPRRLPERDLVAHAEAALKEAEWLRREAVEEARAEARAVAMEAMRGRFAHDTAEFAGRPHDHPASARLSPHWHQGHAEPGYGGQAIRPDHYAAYPPAHGSSPAGGRDDRQMMAIREEIERLKSRLIRESARRRRV